MSLLYAVLALGLPAPPRSQAQQPQRCTTSVWACDMAGLPFEPVPVLSVLGRALSDNPDLARSVQQIVAVPCAELLTNQRAGIDCADPAAPHEIIEARTLNGRTTGTIAVGRELVGETIPNILAVQRILCVLYAEEQWGSHSEEAIDRCLAGER